MKKLTLIPVVALLCSCATFQQITPAQVQTDVTTLGELAKPYVSAKVGADLHNFAVQLQTTTNIAQLISLLPKTGIKKVDDFIAQVATYAKLGKPYSDAVANGLLANF